MPGLAGKVYLIGAGPGDPKLLTLRGLECLQEVDVILYDGLVNPRLLVHAKPACQTICVGKHGQTRVWTQGEIDDEMVRFAKLGKVVGRLKGGDPAVFARTAEELDRLIREGIPFEVVPGITAALAASSYAGIPITHRDWASAAAVVTAQSQAIDGGVEAEEGLDWDALARFPGTLVFYMGVTTASQWSARLIAAGKSAQTPTALIRNCSLPNQQVLHCTLSEVADRLTPASQFRPPVITIVGNVTTLAAGFDWFSSRPLFGTSILLTRPVQQADPWRRVLEELGAEVLVQPAIAVETFDGSLSSGFLSRLKEQDWIVFSSRQGVKSFFELLWNSGKDLREIGNARLAAVGPSTAAAIRGFQLRCDCFPESDRGAEGLLAMLRSQVAEKKCLIVRGDQGKDLLEKELPHSGAEVEVAIVYRNTPIDRADPTLLDRMERGQIAYTTVTSETIAQSLITMFGDRLHKTRLLSLSSAITLALEKRGFQVYRQMNDIDGESKEAWLQIVSPVAEGDRAEYFV